MSEISIRVKCHNYTLALAGVTSPLTHWVFDVYLPAQNGGTYVQSFDDLKGVSEFLREVLFRLEQEAHS